MRAVGSPVVLAQVMANLLANCARHAPGSLVSVSARRRGRRIVIAVRDSGPASTRPGSRSWNGVHPPAYRRQGLGLYLSGRLLSSEGGELRIQPTWPGSKGCTVLVGADGDAKHARYQRKADGRARNAAVPLAEHLRDPRHHRPSPQPCAEPRGHKQQ
jgi:two-component system OmpR family sensor kinase